MTMTDTQYIDDAAEMMGWKEGKKTIIRVEKNKDNPFVMMDRRPLEKDYLSWKAKGLLAYLLSRPDNWTVNFGDLVKRSTDGEHATRAAANELKNAGHLEVKRITDEQGRVMRYEYVVYEKPHLGFPQVDNPDVGNPDVENRDINDTNINDKEYNDITGSASGKNAATAYEENIGVIVPHLKDRLLDAVDEHTEHWVIEAIKIAAENGVRKWAYVEAILNRWKVSGYGTDQKKPQKEEQMKKQDGVSVAERWLAKQEVING